MDYFLHVFILVGVYVVLALAADLLTGQTGILSLTQAAFFGVGAYSSALLSTRFSASFPTGLLVGIVVAIGLSIIVAVPSLRLHGDYFVIATFGFQIIVSSVLENWTSLTDGPLGIGGVPAPTLWVLEVRTRWAFALLTVIMVIFALVVTGRLSSGPFGRTLRAIREDEVFAQALGKNTLRIKLVAFGTSAGLTALAGGTYAHYLGFIDPSSFTPMESILIVSMVIIGGAANPWGALIGAALLVVLPEGLRFLGLPGPIAANLRQIIYGCFLAIAMVARPRGLVGRYGFDN